MKKKLSLEHLYSPPRSKYDDGRKNPLLVLVHGYGADQYDLFSLAAELPDVFHVVSPRAVIDLPFGGAAWYSLNFESAEHFTDVPEAVASREKLTAFISEAVQQYDADPQDVWYLGFSQGAILGYSILSHTPSLARRYMLLSGYVEPRIMAPEVVGVPADTKVFATHGTADPVIPVSWARAAKKYMDSIGIDDEYSEYPMGHGISPDSFHAMKVWLQKYLDK